MALKTANTHYEYSRVFHNKTLDQWVQLIHEKNTAVNKWRHSPLKIGSFGYDNLAVCIAHVFLNIESIEKLHRYDNIDEIADLVHKGWVLNYTYWRDNKPWIKNKFYTRPAKPLGDEVRNKLSITPFCELPQDEKYKDLYVAKFMCDETHAVARFL